MISFDPFYHIVGIFPIIDFAKMFPDKLFSRSLVEDNKIRMDLSNAFQVQSALIHKSTMIASDLDLTRNPFFA